MLGLVLRKILDKWHYRLSFSQNDIMLFGWDLLKFCQKVQLLSIYLTSFHIEVVILILFVDVSEIRIKTNATIFIGTSWDIIVKWIQSLNVKLIPLQHVHVLSAILRSHISRCYSAVTCDRTWKTVLWQIPRIRFHEGETYCRLSCWCISILFIS